MTLEEKDQNIIRQFSELSDWEQRYRKLIEIGKDSEGLPEEERTEDLKVKGCQSQVWIKTDFKDGRILFRVDSDALIVKGLVTLLKSLFSGEKPADILSYQPKFILELGLQNNLSPSRANGLSSMLKQIKFYAIAYQASARLE